MSGDPQETEFGVVAAWTADALVGRDRPSILAGASRGSGSPAALAWLAESLHLAPGATLLDVGAGLGGPLAWATERYGITPVGVEPMFAATSGSARLFGHPLINAAAEKLPLRDACVETAWMLGVLDTVDQPAAVVSEARRVLGGSGRLGVLAFVAEGVLDAAAVPEGNHFQTLSDLEATFEAAGFSVVDRVDGGQLPDPPLDWQVRQDRLREQLEVQHGDDPRWHVACSQERRFAELLRSGSVSLVLLNALCI